VTHWESSALVSLSRAAIFGENRGASDSVEDSKKNECKTDRQGRNTIAPNERLAHASPVPVAGEGLSRVEMSQELSFLGTGASFARPKGRSARVRRVFVRADMDSPEVIAVVPLPTPLQRSLMLVMVNIVLVGDPLRLETAAICAVRCGARIQNLCRLRRIPARRDLR